MPPRLLGAEQRLADNCFGDYYTRTGLTDAQREMITFCYLAAQGGVEPQLLAHAKANIGYPRTLNALGTVGEAEQSSTSAE